MRNLLPILILIFSVAAEATNKVNLYVSVCLPYMETANDAIEFVFNCEKTQEIQIEIDEISKSGKWEQKFNLTDSRFNVRIEAYESVSRQNLTRYTIEAKIQAEGGDLATIYKAYHPNDYATLIAHKIIGPKQGWPHLHFGDPKLVNKEAHHEEVMKKFLIQQMKAK